MPSVRTRSDIVLKVTAGKAAGTERVLSPGETLTIGRSEEAGLPIQDGKISRLHCRIEQADGRWVVKDLESRNGTWVASRRITEHALADGETIVVGGSVPVVVRIRGAAVPGASGRRVVFPPKKGEDPAPVPIPSPEPLPELTGPLAALPGGQ